MTASRLGNAWDRLRIEAAVRRVDLKLDGVVRSRRRREIRDELRANLLVAAEEKGAREAVRQLGDLGEFAAAYADAMRARVNVRAGLACAALVFVVLQLISAAFFFGYRTAFEAAGGRGDWSYAYGLGEHLTLFEAEGGPKWFAIALLPLPALALILLTFLVASRSWRVLSRRL